nr:hypothetical protein [Bifidobacterium catenulatum]
MKGDRRLQGGVAVSKRSGAIFRFLSFPSSLLAGVFALVADECQGTLIDSKLIGVAIRRADRHQA